MRGDRIQRGRVKSRQRISHVVWVAEVRTSPAWQHGRLFFCFFSRRLHHGAVPVRVWPRAWPGYSIQHRDEQAAGGAEGATTAITRVEGLETCMSLAMADNGVG